MNVKYLEENKQIPIDIQFDTNANREEIFVK